MPLPSRGFLRSRTRELFEHMACEKRGSHAIARIESTFADTPLTDRTPGIYWTALREGQDWVDDDVIAAVNWLSSLVPSSEWTQRLDAANSFLEAAKSDWAQGKRTALYDPSDVMPWYMMQAANYAYPDRRPNFFEPEGYRIAPVIRRLGQLLPMLRQVGCVDERNAHLMSRGVNPDDVIYELLVAGTYRRRWPMVDFIPEEKGRQKRPDLFVTRGRSSWAIECKRTGRSGYARDERDTGQRMAKLVHELAKRTGRSLALLVTFNAELVELGDNHLLEKAAEFLERDEHFLWGDSASTGMVCDVSWRGLHQILRSDDIYFGGSRMIELLLGVFRHDVDYDVDGDWTPAEGRPLHATWVDRVSLVAWRSLLVSTRN